MLHEARVLESLGVEPLSGVLIEPPPRSGYTGVLASLGFEGPHMRRTELAVAQLNRVGPDGKSLALAVGQAVAVARSLPDGVPAHVFFRREIQVPDPQVMFGHDSARELRSDNRFKEVDYYTYGDLEVGIKKGLLVEMVVH